MDEEMLTTQEVAERFHVSIATVRSYVYAGKLQRYRRAGRKENFFRLSDAKQALGYVPSPPKALKPQR